MKRSAKGELKAKVGLWAAGEEGRGATEGAVAADKRGLS